MRKLSLLLLVAVVLAGGIYAVQAYADKGGNGTVDVTTAATVQGADQSSNPNAQCPKHRDCPADCGHTGKCTSGCPNFVDEDKDGKCDQHGTHHAAATGQGCPGHTGGGCGGRR